MPVTHHAWSHAVKPPNGTRFVPESNLRGHWLVTNGGPLIIPESFPGVIGNGVVMGNPTWVQDGNLGGTALDLDGVGDYIDFGNPFVGLDPETDTWAVSVRVRIDAMQPRHGVIGLNGAGIDHLVLAIWSDDVVKIGSNGYTPGDDGVTHVIGEVADWCMAWDGSDLFFYDNGLLSYSTTPTATSWLSSLDELWIGYSSLGGMTEFTGAVSNVRVYHPMPTDAQILADALMPYREFRVRRYWTFESVAGGTFDEIVTLSGAAAVTGTPQVDMVGAVTLTGDVSQSGGNIADLVSTIALTGNVATSVVGNLILDAIATLAANATITALENLGGIDETITLSGNTTLTSVNILDAMESLGLSGNVSATATHTLTLSVLAELIGALAATAAGSLVIPRTVTLSAEAAISAIDEVLSGFIETISLSGNVTLTATQEADLVEAITLAIQGAVISQAAHVMENLISLGVDGSVAASGSLAISQAVTLQIVGIMAATSSVSSGAFGKILKQVSQALNIPGVTGEALKQPGTTDETLDS